MEKIIEIPEGYEARIEGNKVILELKESEDERIRKALISILKSDFDGDTIIYGTSVSDIIAWLEKQGDDISSFPKEQQKYMERYISLDKLTLIKLLAERDRNTEEITKSFEKQSEQRSVDKIEPKFKVGDWITNGIDVDKIIGIDLEDENYLFENGGKSDISLVESISHIWIIKNAKDGDVLANDTIVLIVDHLGTFENRPIIYSWYFSDSNKFYGPGPSESDRWEVKGFHPATKEQRDLLFQKMKEAGYEWDAKKKELKKIEQEQAIDCLVDVSRDNWEFVHEFVEKFGRIPKDEDELNCLVEYVVKRQKPNTWSEEDEHRITDTIYFLDTAKKHYASTEELDNCIEWLKSLKERYTWKPSDEQINTLWGAIVYVEGCNSNFKGSGSVLENLYSDLKKLRG